MRAKIYCEITCNSCGNLAPGSGYYTNANRIKILKTKNKNWIWDDEFSGNLCPDCQEERKKKS